MDDYLLTVRVPLSAPDNIGARIAVADVIATLNLDQLNDADVKLQRLVPGKPPEGVALPSPSGDSA
jgi:hypothetical protein